MAEKYKSGLLGFRLWSFEDNGLYSIGYKRTLWQPGVNTARCPVSDHQAPDSECECGFYAYNSIDNPGDGAIADSIGMVIGAVIASGNLLIHADGFRAEKVIVAGLYYPELNQPGHLSEKDLAEVSEDFSAPLFSDKDEFIDYTKTLNCLTPDELA